MAVPGPESPVPRPPRPCHHCFDDPRRPSRRRVVASARLSRQPRAGEPDRARHRAWRQPAGRHRIEASTISARRLADRRQRGADNSRPRFAGALLSLAAGTRRLVRTRRRKNLLRTRISAIGAGARALLDAAGAAQHRHWPQRCRYAPERSRARRRGAAMAVVTGYRTAIGAAGHHGRHPNVGCLGDRHRNSRYANRANEPRQLHLYRLADPELGIRCIRLHRSRSVGPCGRSTARARASRRGPPQQHTCSCGWNWPDCAHVGSAAPRSGSAQGKLRDRCQDLHRAIRVGSTDRAAPAGRRPHHCPPAWTRIQRAVRCADLERGRHRRRLFRNALGKSHATPRRATPRAIAHRTVTVAADNSRY